ncbi:hypothetical protein JCM6882_000658 [Rhodosporidiobolus microsporus]
MSPDASYVPPASTDSSASLKPSAPAPSREGETRQSADAQSFGFDSSPDLKALCTPPTFGGDVEAERAYLKERLTAALRIFAREGMDHHVAGHLTVRDPEHPTHFWVNPFGLSFAVMTVSDLIRVDHEGNVDPTTGKEGRRVVNKAGFLIHSAIHKARPDVQAICHSHSLYGKTWSTLGLPLPLTTQDACTAFYGPTGLAHLSSFGGVVLSSGEGDRIAEALGPARAIVLQNHGILTAGSSIDSAVASYILLETQCRVQLLALSACAALGAGAKPIEIDDEEAKFTAGENSEALGYFLASPYFQRVEREEGADYKQ